jgi:hypothetical protein
MVPVVKTGGELPQIFTDLRLSDTLKWKEAVVIAEEYASKFLDTFILKIKCSEVVISFVVNVFLETRSPQYYNCDFE